MKTTVISLKIIYNEQLKLSICIAFPRLENLRCCSWSEDGHRLLIGAGKKLVLCSWQDLSDISTFVVCVCDSFDTHGNISCISSVGESCFVASTEVQLDKLCSLKIDEDLFEIPQLSNGCELVEGKLETLF